MKSYKQYLTESQAERLYQFKVKIAGEAPAECIKEMQTALDKYGVAKFAKGKTSPIQKTLEDFPGVENESFTVYEVDLKYPITSAVLHSFISEKVSIPASRIKVRNLAEIAEEELNVSTLEKSDTALLLKTEDEKSDNQDLVGDKKVTSFLKDLAAYCKETKPQPYTGVNDELLAKNIPTGKDNE